LKAAEAADTAASISAIPAEWTSEVRIEPSIALLTVNFWLDFASINYSY
jgi:hypothetical protein